jgi:anti-sigma factor RsiW
MKCSDWEERIALHAGRDLPPAEAAEVERHLRECAGCQVLASGLQQSLALLKEAHHEPLAAAHFLAVRARVVAELE